MQGTEDKLKNIDTLLSRLEREVGNKLSDRRVVALPKRSKLKKISSPKVIKKNKVAKAH